MNTGRLQFRHYDGIFDSREQAYEYLTNIVDSTRGEDYRLDETLVGEPILVKYKDSQGNVKALVAVGTVGEPGSGEFAPYHIVDTAKLEEDIASLSGSTTGVTEDLQQEIERAMAAEAEIQSELDATQTGAGLESDGTYTPNDESNYIKEATSLKDADNKIDTELARVEKARKDVTGQDTDEYVPNESLVTRPIAYIADAESLNDADVKLDEAIQELNKETIKNVVVDEVSGTVENNIAIVNISGNSVPIGPYEQYEGPATQPHPIHDSYSVLDAVKQLDTNFIDFTDKQKEALDGLHVVKVTDGLAANVREAYDLVNKDGLVQENSDRILIYKDSSLYTVYLGHVDDRLESYDEPTVIPGTGDTALCLIYLRVDGLYELATINVESFLAESEFKDGLSVENHIVKVKIDEHSEDFLTVSTDGVKLAGVQDAIDIAKAAEELRAREAETELTNKLTETNVGAGLNFDGTYKGHDSQTEGMAYINTATSIDDATVALDLGIQYEKARAQSAENGINNALNELSATTNDLIIAVDNDIERLDGKIDDETTRATDAEEALDTKVDALEETLDTKIDAETTRATAAEQGLDAKIDSEVLAEKNRAITAEEALDNKIDTEISGENDRAEAAEEALDTKIDSEITRATGAEETITENLNTLSGSVETLSAGTVSEFERVDEKIDNEKVRAMATESEIQSELDTTQTGAGLESDGTYHKHNTAGDMGNYIATATSLDNATVLLDAALKEKSDSIEALSAGTESEIERLGNLITKNEIDSEEGTITISRNTDETIVDVNYDKKTIVSDANGVLGTGLKFASLPPSELEANVKEAFKLVDSEGTPVDNTTIKIYKSSALQEVKLVTIDGKQYIEITYINNSGETSNTLVDIHELIAETEFKDGLTVNGDGEVRVKIDEMSEAFLTVSSNGVKLSGVQDAIDVVGDSLDDLSASTVSKFELLENTWNTPGSIKHTIDDSFIKSVAVGSAEAANKSLLRYYEDGEEHKYYASNNTADMEHNGSKLSTVIETINTTITALSGGSETVISGMTEKIETISGDVITISGNVQTISGNVQTVSADVQTVSGQLITTQNELQTVSGELITTKEELATVSGQLVTTQEELQTVSGQLVTLMTNFDTMVYEKVKEIIKATAQETKVTSDDTEETVTIGFAQDAIFGPFANS